ncbi:hypothetical protein [Legionella sp. km772]|uniref:hypothetical protein n=1 Tax=Legionella sp. km772 TaxID=2498111 RepID=UPI000F8DA2FC|nr:hypothetical protein [Legionella sp. km772]RUR04246.1 hypothetical protein ELY15_15750 [Legionella sp. km772]
MKISKGNLSYWVQDLAGILRNGVIENYREALGYGTEERFTLISLDKAKHYNLLIQYSASLSHTPSEREYLTKALFYLDRIIFLSAGDLTKLEERRSDLLNKTREVLAFDNQYTSSTADQRNPLPSSASATLFNYEEEILLKKINKISVLSDVHEKVQSFKNLLNNSPNFEIKKKIIRCLSDCYYYLYDKEKASVDSGKHNCASLVGALVYLDQLIWCESLISAANEDDKVKKLLQQRSDLIDNIYHKTELTTDTSVHAKLITMPIAEKTKQSIVQENDVLRSAEMILSGNKTISGEEIINLDRKMTKCADKVQFFLTFIKSQNLNGNELAVIFSKALNFLGGKNINQKRNEISRQVLDYILFLKLARSGDLEQNSGKIRAIPGLLVHSPYSQNGLSTSP